MKCGRVDLWEIATNGCLVVLQFNTTLKVALIRSLDDNFTKILKKSSLYSQSLLIFIHKTPVVENHLTRREIRELLWPRPHDYKKFFMLNSAEHEISMLGKSHLINLLDKLFIYRKFHCFCLSNETFKFELSYTLYH